MPDEACTTTPAGTFTFARCESCMYGEHEDPHTPHPWAGEEDIAHALATGQDVDGIRNSVCACWCAVPTPELTPAQAAKVAAFGLDQHDATELPPNVTVTNTAEEIEGAIYLALADGSIAAAQSLLRILAKKHPMRALVVELELGMTEEIR